VLRFMQTPGTQEYLFLLEGSQNLFVCLFSFLLRPRRSTESYALRRYSPSLGCSGDSTHSLTPAVHGECLFGEAIKSVHSTLSVAVLMLSLISSSWH
jgi:hypothetical protein